MTGPQRALHAPLSAEAQSPGSNATQAQAGKKTGLAGILEAEAERPCCHKTRIRGEGCPIGWDCPHIQRGTVEQSP